MKRETLKNNQHIITESHKADTFYIVFEGEFEIVKNLSLLPKKRVDPKWYFNKGHDDFKSYYHTVVQKFNHINKLDRNVVIKFIGPGQIFGLEDSITRKDDYRYYSYSVVCRSATGIVLGFSRVDTFTKLAYNENTWRYLQQLAKDTVERLGKTEKISKKRIRLMRNQNRANKFKLK